MNRGAIWAAVAAAAMMGCSEMSSDTGGGGSRGGKAGSMARFQVVGDYLYALSGNQLHVYGVIDPARLSFQNSVDVGFGVETLFPYRGNLFLGTQTGMLLYSLGDRTNPVFLSRLEHFRSCDPVVVEGDLAFVTLRSGNRCWAGNNELQIVDVSDLSYPVRLKSFPMANPHGLGVDGDLLFICDGYAGLKAYRVGSGLDLTLLDHVQAAGAYDVIPNGNRKLIFVGSDGLLQFDYGVFPMRQLSRIPIGS